MLRHELDIGCQVWAWCRRTRTVRFGSVLGTIDDDFILSDAAGSFPCKPDDCHPTRRAALEDSLALCNKMAAYYRVNYVEDFERAAAEIAATLAGLPADEDYDPDAAFPNCTSDIVTSPRADLVPTRMALATEDV